VIRLLYNLSFFPAQTYENKGNKTVWVQSQQSGLDKRQATVHLCIFADGIPRIKPAIIFPGKGQLRDRNERSKYDKGITVYFQKKAWADEEFVIKWLKEQWRPAAYDPIHGFQKSQEPRMLVLDVLRSQKTAAVKETFKRLNTLPVMVPPGCTSLVQPLDVCINHSFKERIEALSHEHYHQNINGWTDQKFTAAYSYDQVGCTGMDRYQQRSY